jgi:crossover junction endodeoxyribonuclease RuvC
MPPNRRVLGIDPGLTVTGFGVVDGDGVHAALIEAGTFRSNAKAPRHERLREIFDRVGALILQHHPQDLAIEAHFVHHLDVYEYPPKTVKESITGFGAAPKEQVQAMVMAHLGMTAAPERLDASDALAIALTRLAGLRYEALMAGRS